MVNNFVVNNGKRTLEGKYELSVRPRIEFNTLTMVEASLLNRDDANKQKSVVVGGVSRMRISSQCLKRPIRKAIANDAMNTRRISYLVLEEFANDGLTDEEAGKIESFVFYFLGEAHKDYDNEGEDKKTKKAYYVSEEELRAILMFIRNHKDEILSAELKEVESKKKKKDGEEKEKAYNFKEIFADGEVEKFKTALVMDTPMSSEVAICGRMETSGVLHETEAAVHIAHAFSTDELSNEFDFFSANEDVKILDVEEKRWGTNQESIIPGESDINSNTLYSYARLDVGVLIDNLCIGRDISKPEVQEFVKKEAVRMATEFAWAFVEVRPTAKQSSCATYTRPDLAYVTIGDAVPSISYGNVYNKPVSYYKNKSVMEHSIERLQNELEANCFNRNKYIGRYWVEPGRKDVVFSENLGIETKKTYADVVSEIADVINSVTFERKE